MGNDPPPSPSSTGRCSCNCHCCSLPATWPRSVKRKLDAAAAGGGAESDAAELRDALAAAQQTIQDLYAELDAERSASDSSADDAMLMIIRLQREKADAVMEARQFKRVAEERMAHDEEEIAALDEILYSREESIRSLSGKIESLRRLFLSHGLPVPDSDPDPDEFGPDHGTDDADPDSYGGDEDEEEITAAPSSSQSVTEKGILVDDLESEERIDRPAAEATNDTEKGILVDDLESEEERTDRAAAEDVSDSVVTEKGILVDDLEKEERTDRVAAEDVSDSVVTEKGILVDGLEKEERTDRCATEDARDRVYTIDAVHGAPPQAAAACEDECRVEGGLIEERVVRVEGDMKKLLWRLEALEADRDSMKQAMVVVRSERVHLAMLREITQQLYREVKPDRGIAKMRPPPPPTYSFVAIVKWIASFLFWRRKAITNKYTFGQSKNNAGLLMLLDKSPNLIQWRYLTRR